MLQRPSIKSLKELLILSPGKIWRSPISWRIALVVFATILTVQVTIFGLTVGERERQELGKLKTLASRAVAQIIPDRISGMLQSPITDAQWQRLQRTTHISGLTVYSADMLFLKSYGNTPIITLLKPEDRNETYWSADGSFYEFVMKPYDINGPYLVVARVSSEQIAEEKINFAKQNLLILLLMSGLVTTVLMAALSRWLLEPILFLRSNLLLASKDPENPVLQPNPFNQKDEIGQAINIAHNLITQNAKNIRQIKNSAQDQIYKLAYYDGMTGLPNRTLFQQKLTELTREENTETPQEYAVITIDLDHFKDVNDSMGHQVGDALLRAVGKRLRSALPESAVVARTGEDEYAVMMPLNATMNSARDVGERILRVIRAEPFKVYSENFQIRASIGVSTFPRDGADPDQVLKNADIALNRAKEEGRDTLKEYTEDFDKAVQQRFQMLRDLRDALETNQLELYYQPQFDLKTGRVIGAEALLRWFKKDNSKEGGSFISPGVFIPIAEQSGLIVPIGEWVMIKACERAVQWREENGYDIRIAVNVSGAQFHQSDLVSYTSSVLEKTGLPPHLLELEVTESAFMEDIQQTINILRELHALGVELAIDDFGTGYSSLSYLRQFPIDRLKIDQSFIRNALNDPNDASIARTIIALGRALNLKVIAEGVEIKEQEAFLVEEGCDEVQGFRYSKPIPYEKFVAFIRSYNNDFRSFD